MGALLDAFPVRPDHVLIVSQRHVASLFDLSAEEQQGIWALVGPVKEVIDRIHAPLGYNVGANIGRVAGQTIDHVHVHVIPRYAGGRRGPAWKG